MKSIKEYQQGFLFSKVKQFLRAKAEFYRLFFLAVVAQGGFILFTRLGESQEVVVSIKDLMERQDLKDNDVFKVVPFTLT